jgi:hypothetical protein
LHGTDSDNGSEFINHHLRAYCATHAIQFTRGRPYKKDDTIALAQRIDQQLTQVYRLANQQVRPTERSSSRACRQSADVRPPRW